MEDKDIKIQVIVPILEREYDRPKKLFTAAVGPGCEIGVVFIEAGPASIESEFDEALAAPEVIARVFEAEQAGFAAVVVDCFGDPGVKAARELVNIPIVGAGEAAMYLAASLGHKFSILAVDRGLLSMFYNNCTICGLANKLALYPLC